MLIIFYWWIRRTLRQASTCFPQSRIICLFVQIADPTNNDKIIPEIYDLLFIVCPYRQLQIMRLNISWGSFFGKFAAAAAVPKFHFVCFHERGGHWINPIFDCFEDTPLCVFFCRSRWSQTHHTESKKVKNIYIYPLSCYVHYKVQYAQHPTPTHPPTLPPFSSAHSYMVELWEVSSDMGAGC